MGFLDNLTENIKRFGGELASQIGLTLDMSRAMNQTQLDALDPIPVIGNVDEAASDVAGYLSSEAEAMWDDVSTPLRMTNAAARIARQASYKEGGDWWNREATEWGTFFKGSTWSQAFDEAQNLSLGQTTADLYTTSAFRGKDIQEQASTATDREWAEYRKNSLGYNLLSGGLDFIARWYLDPINVGGKFMSAFRLGMVSRPIKAGEDVAEEMVKVPTGAIAKRDPRNLHNRFKKLIEETDDWDANQFMVGIDGLEDATNGMAVASAMAKANKIADKGARWRQKQLVLALTHGSTRAVDELKVKNVELVDQLAKAKIETNDAIKAASWEEIGPGKIRYVNTPEAKAFIADRVKKLGNLEEEIAKQSDYMLWMQDNLLDVSSHRSLRMTNKSRMKAEYGTQTVIQKSLWNIPIRVWHAGTTSRPLGEIAIDDPRSINQLRSMFDQVPDLPPETRNKLLSRYISTDAPGARGTIVEQSKAAIIAHEAKRAGIPKEEAETLLNEYLAAERSLFKFRGDRGMPTQNRYSAATDPETGVAADMFVTDDGVANVIAPMLKPQLKNTESLLDVKALQRAIKRTHNRRQAFAKWVDDYDQLSWRHSTAEAVRAADKARWGVGEAVGDLAQWMRKWWVFSVLARPAYMLRTLTDDQMAITSQLGSAAVGLHVEGAWSALKGAGRGLTGKEMWNAKAAHADDIFRKQEFDDRLADGGKLTMAERAELKEIDVRLTADPNDWPDIYGTRGARLGEGMAQYRGVTFDDAFGGPEANLQRKLSSSQGLHDVVLHEGENSLYARGTRSGGGWVIVQPHEPHYRAAWKDALNKQLRNDPMAMEFIRGAGIDDVRAWLKTPEGRLHAKDMFIQKSDQERWMRNVKATVDQYIPNPGWREVLKKRDLKDSEIQAFIDNEGQALPTVHGAALEANLGKGAWANAANRGMNQIMRALAEIPTDRLARHPLYVALYRQRATQMIDQILDDPNRASQIWTKADDARLYKQAHAYALKGVKDTLYDASAHSNLAHTMRFVAPFMGAWQETLGRWGRLVKNKPQILGYASLLWQAPNKFGVVVNREGDEVDTSTEITDDEALIVGFPAWLGPTQFKVTGDFVPYLYKASLSLQLQGDPWWMPGFSPAVQIPMGYFATDQPAMKDFVEFWGLTPPGGVPKDMADAVLPAHLKRLASFLDEGKTRRDFATDSAIMFRQMKADWRLGGEKTPWNDDQMLAEAKKRTKNLYLLKWGTSFISPASTQYKSKYQFYIDAYNQLKQQASLEKRTPEWVDDTFIKDYGEIFWEFASTPISAINAYAPATAEGVAASKKRAEWISKYPELSGGIIGPEGLGPNGEYEFNELAYQYQQTHSFQEGNSDTFRSFKDPREAADAQAKNVGWRDYSKFVMMLDAIAVSRGETTHHDDDQLMAMKRAMVDQIAGENPAWRKDYFERDEDWFNRQFEAIEDMVGSGSFKDRPDFEHNGTGLKQYVEIRNAYQAMLASRKAAGGSADPGAKSNQQLMRSYAAIVYDMKERNTYFDEHWFIRVLERDPMLAGVNAMVE